MDRDSNTSVVEYNDGKRYLFAIYQAPLKYKTYSIIGSNKADRFKDKLKTNNYYFTMAYTTKD